MHAQSASCQYTAGWAHVYAGEREKAVAAMERMVVLADSPVNRGMLADVLAIAGRPGAAIEAAEGAMQQSPNDPWLPHWLRSVARAHFTAGRYEEAARFAEESIGYNYHDLWNSQAATYEVLAASYSQLGRLAEARTAFAETSELAPHRTSEWVSLLYGIAEPEHRERYVTALRRAGLED